MKADAKPTLDDVAMTLCKGAAPPEWVIERLRKYAAFVADTAEHQGDEIDRLSLKSALHLQRLLPLTVSQATLMHSALCASKYPSANCRM